MYITLFIAIFLDSLAIYVEDNGGAEVTELYALRVSDCDLIVLFVMKISDIHVRVTCDIYRFLELLLMCVTWPLFMTKSRRRGGSSFSCSMMCLH
jgi:hypothetical protein